jgi:hypothetical protein
MYRLFLFIILGIIAFFLFMGCTSKKNKFLTSNPLCGPRSLLFICQQNKIPATLDELCELTEYSKTKGTTMYGLYEAAYKKGLSPSALKLSINKLIDIGEPCIVFVNGNHFMVFLNGKNNILNVLNPPDIPDQISSNEFLKIWNGETLIFNSKDPVSYSDNIKKNTNSVNGPHVNISKTEHYFGVVDEGTVQTYSFSILNSGNDILKILAIQIRCNCLEALPYKKNISPGDSGVIDIKFETKGKSRGRSIQRVAVKTNDPINPYTFLTLEAIIQTPAKAIPDKIFLGEVNRGNTIQRIITVNDTGYGTLKIEKVTAPNGIYTEILPATEDSLKKRSIPIKLTVKAIGSFGTFDKKIVIHTNATKYPDIEVPISGIITSEIMAFPQKIFFGQVKYNTTEKREVTLSYNGEKSGENILIKKIITPKYTTTKFLNNGHKVILTVSLHAPSHKITISDSIKVYSDNLSEPIVMIPIFSQIGNP